MTIGTCKLSGVDRVANNSAMYDHLNCRGKKKIKKKKGEWISLQFDKLFFLVVVVSGVEANEWN